MNKIMSKVKTHDFGPSLRWWGNRMGRPLSPPQIHWKNIWTLSKLHKTTSECWQKTSGTQKSSALSLKGGHLYFLPPSSLLNPTLWISVGVLGYGEHLGNRVLPRSVSPLDSPLFSSCSPLSPFSLSSSSHNSVNLSGCPSLWRIFSPLT